MLNMRSRLQAWYCDLLAALGHRSTGTIKVVVRNSVFKFQQSAEVAVGPTTQQASADRLLQQLRVSRLFGPGSLEPEGVLEFVSADSSLVDGATYDWYPPTNEATVWYPPSGQATRCSKHW
jgi:hypothetical protein